MKLLVVFVSVLVLVAQGKVIRFIDQERVHAAEQQPAAPKEQGAYGAESEAEVQEDYALPNQGLFPGQVRVFGAEEGETAGSPEGLRKTDLPENGSHSIHSGTPAEGARRYFLGPCEMYVSVNNHTSAAEDRKNSASLY